MGSLQKIKGSLKVRKVEFSEGSGSVMIEADSLNFKELAEAQVMANKVISEGKIVRGHFFDSLEEAQKAFPSLRAHEERIRGRVRIVEVDGFDYSACTGKHVENTRECGMILITHVSKSGGEYRIDFEVGEKALETAVRLSTLCLSISSILCSPIRNLEKTVVNMRAENEDLRKRLSAVAEDIVRRIPSEDVSEGVELYTGLLKGVEVKTVMRIIGELIEEKSSVYVIGLEWLGTCSILVGSSVDKVDSSKLIKEVSCAFKGKGGGDKRVAMGSFPCNDFVKAFEEIRKRVKDLLSRGAG